MGGPGMSTNSLYNDGYYSYNSDQCPSCDSHGARRQLLGTSSAAASQDGEKVWGVKNGPGIHSIGSMYLEDGSFDDGPAAYARFFMPMGIAVTGDGLVAWIGDYGNNKIRNISCSNARGPTFEPTRRPTKKPLSPPTAFPVRAARSSKTSRSGGTQTKSRGGGGGSNTKMKGGTVVVNRGDKSGGSKTSSIGSIVARYAENASGMSPGTIAAIVICSLLAAAGLLTMGYYRSRLMAQTAAAAKSYALSLPTAYHEDTLAGASASQPDDFGLPPADSSSSSF